MGFLLTDNFIKIEIIFLGVVISYILFHFIYEISSLFSRLKSIIMPKRILIKEQLNNISPEENLDSNKNSESENDNKTEKISINEDSKVEKDIKEDKAELSKIQKDELSEIIKFAQTKINRGEYSDAKAKIIEGLSIDKFNKQLNLQLASLYEKDKDYKKAEFIYKDLIVLNDHDTEIYLKLGFILSIQTKYEVAFEIYKKLNSLDKSNVEAIEMLANLAHHLGNYEDSKAYSKIFLKKSPRNVDILYLQSLNLINLEERKDALETLLKVKQLEPYNIKVNELIEKLKLEIELEKNFNNSGDNK
ncbi:MAG: hypothetical protein PHZ26_00535 [Candidatus Gracilibacteria bacterium]|nr:hypothetical protein [Candidatus Gracilibacteria bacterium]MDD2908224.1 hypothetical protein [Candidatus Gracilibacteria bacterium]